MAEIIARKVEPPQVFQKVERGGRSKLSPAEEKYWFATGIRPRSMLPDMDQCDRVSKRQPHALGTYFFQ